MQLDISAILYYVQPRYTYFWCCILYPYHTPVHVMAWRHRLLILGFY